MSNHGTTYLAYYWRPYGIPIDGWHERKTVACDSTGHILSPAELATLQDEGWRAIGYYKFGEEPDDVWEAAREKKS